MTDDSALIAALRGISTATITTVLLKKGLRRIAMVGPKPLAAAKGRRIAGRAFTLRFIPAREDLATPESWSSPRSTRAAIEDMPEGAVAVVDAMGVTSAGIFGDILCARMKMRGVAALITDGAVRDVAGVTGAGLPVWCAGVAAPASVAGHLRRKVQCAITKERVTGQLFGSRFVADPLLFRLYNLRSGLVVRSPMDARSDLGQRNLNSPSLPQ